MVASGDAFEGVGEVIKELSPLRGPWVQKLPCKLEPRCAKRTNGSLHPSLGQIQLNAKVLSPLSSPEWGENII